METVVEHGINQLFSTSQHGSLIGGSCDSNMLITMDKWTESLDANIPLETVNLDFAKAFDNVTHQRLLLKLEQYRINEDTLKWMKSYLSDGKQ